MTELPLIGEAVAVAARASGARKLAGAKIGVVTFPGTLDDRDAARAVRLAGAEPVALWHADKDLGEVDAVVLPGGFSYGDYLRAGAISRFAPVMAAIIDAADSEAGCRSWASATASRSSPRRTCCPARCSGTTTCTSSAATRCCGWRTPTPPGPRDYAAGQEITIPLKNKDGRYVADEHTLDELEAEGRVVFRYVELQPERLAAATSPASPTPPATSSASCRTPSTPSRPASVGTGPHRRPPLLHLDPQEDLVNDSEPRTPILDTVEHAAETPDVELPWAELGLKKDEYERIVEILGRRPTGAELAMYSVMWSEHCSYKSSQGPPAPVRREGPDETRPCSSASARTRASSTSARATRSPSRSSRTTTRRTSSPTRARPPASAASSATSSPWAPARSRSMDPLRFGAADHPDTKRVLPGVVAGIGGYGNCLGLPNIGGEVVFDACYQGNPLVNAGCVGVMRHEDIHLAKASGAGNKVILYGARTGGDGIGGASVLASETFDDTKPSKRPAVQVGDPFQEKLLIECTLELFKGKLVVGIQDLGAAGLSCATSELASNGSGGMRVELDDVRCATRRSPPRKSS